MSLRAEAFCLLLIAVVAAITIVVISFVRRGVHRWVTPRLIIPGWRATPALHGETHVLLSICDHYEPGNGNVGRAVAADRVRRWVSEYPRLFERFRDADGRP